MWADLIPVAATQIPDLVKADHIELLRVLPIIIVKMEPLASFDFHNYPPLESLAQSFSFLFYHNSVTTLSQQVSLLRFFWILYAKQGGTGL